MNSHKGSTARPLLLGLWERSDRLFGTRVKEEKKNCSIKPENPLNWSSTLSRNKLPKSQEKNSVGVQTLEIRAEQRKFPMLEKGDFLGTILIGSPLLLSTSKEKQRNFFYD